MAFTLLIRTAVCSCGRLKRDGIQCQKCLKSNKRRVISKLRAKKLPFRGGKKR